MAYVSQDDKKAVAPAIKAVLAKYGMKGSISINNHSTLVVTLKSGKLDIPQNLYDNQQKNPSQWNFGDPIKKQDYFDVNHYWIDSHYSDEVKDFLNELVVAMKKPGWRDDSDAMIDYFSITYYITISVGKWNKPFEFNA